MREYKENKGIGDRPISNAAHKYDKAARPTEE